VRFILTRHPFFPVAAWALSVVAAPIADAQTTGMMPVPSRATFASPALRYSTTFGGGVGEGQAIALDGDGNRIIAGNTEERFSFVLVNAADSDPGDADEEGFVAKINADGDAVIFSTYLGGNAAEWVTDIDVDADGNIYVIGITDSTDFPTTAGSLQPAFGNSPGSFGYDGFVTKLDPLGNIVWSTYLGGAETDEAHGVRIGPDGFIYVVGTARSFDFPTTANAYQEDCNEQFNLCQDAFVVKLAKNGKSLVFGSFLGGTPFGEVACSVDVDAEGHVFVVGQYITDGFPYVNPFQDEHDAGSDLFVTKFAPDGESLVWSSGLGGNGTESLCGRFDRGASIALDGNGDAFVGAFTTSTNLPASGTFQPSFGGTTDGYVAKITSEGAFEWGTYFGAERNEAITDLAVLDDGSPVIVGWSDSLGFPETAGALGESECASASIDCSLDVFATVLTSDGTALEYSTLLGGTDTDLAYGIAIANDGALVLGGTTRTELWPLVDPLPEPLQGAGGTLVFIAEIGDDAAPIPGDVNGDGVVSASDALAALGAALGSQQCLLCVCDLNGDGSISATDALLILNLAVGFSPPTNPPAC
jgi:hypothetical protein